MKKIEVAVGSVFGRLTILSIGHTDGKRSAVCQCLCGNKKSARISEISSGRVASCGCLRRETTSKLTYAHGEARVGKASPEYKIWSGMIRRCRPGNKDYGDRGITVCDRWTGDNGFQNFVEDIGRRPSDVYSIDRFPNTLGNYEPGNVRWADDVQQNRNARSNRKISIGGKRMVLAEAIERYALVREGTVRMRLHRGWTPAKAILTPLGGHR